MKKAIAGFFAGILVAAVLAWQVGGSLMVQEYPSPYGIEETAARIQANIQEVGWDLSGLRSPSNTIRRLGATVPNVLLVEACNPDYSKPILKDDNTRILSILMPCTITIYEKEDGKVYIGLMNSGLMGRLFGPVVTDVMQKVAADQQKFITFDSSKPAPPLVSKKPGGGGENGKGGLQDLGGC
ncbi:MAG: DUF302 domain-containing protein [Alphaproteobacteria bacterium]|nr:DUF302 domain-containing protein [Alphaproteobacteria bacterium]